MFLYNFTGIPEIAGLVPDHYYKSKYHSKVSYMNLFLMYIKIIFILHCGLLSTTALCLKNQCTYSN